MMPSCRCRRDTSRPCSSGPDRSGRPIIYAGTKVGLYAHDDENNRFVETPARWPKHDTGGSGACAWRGTVYAPVARHVYAYSPGRRTFDIAFPRRGDDGLFTVAGTRGAITKLVPTHLDLAVVVDGQGAFFTPADIFLWDGRGIAHAHSALAWMSITAAFVLERPREVPALVGDRRGAVQGLPERGLHRASRNAHELAVRRLRRPTHRATRTPTACFERRTSTHGSTRASPR